VVFPEDADLTVLVPDGPAVYEEDALSEEGGAHGGDRGDVQLLVRRFPPPHKALDRLYY
jgi:hypothetical protein